jgi:hypothetical protein
MIAIVAGAGAEALGEDRESILPVIYFFLIVLNVWQPWEFFVLLYGMEVISHG